jgi:anti-anti-sigma regulatory factor
MKINTENRIVRIVLSAECVIAETEVHMDMLKHALAGDIAGIELDAGAVTNIDTAYFQLLLAMKAASARRGISLTVVDRSPEMRQVSVLYGVEIDH